VVIGSDSIGTGKSNYHTITIPVEWDYANKVYLRFVRVNDLGLSGESLVFNKIVIILIL
jgi:hypothetical protein